MTNSIPAGRGNMPSPVFGRGGRHAPVEKRGLSIHPWAPNVIRALRALCGFCLVLILSACRTADLSGEDKISLIKKGEQVTGSLLNIIRETPGKKGQVRDAALLVFKKLKEGEISISIDPGRPGNIYEGAAFSCSIISAERRPLIIISPYLLKIHDSRPSIVYSILIHEFAHAYSFFRNRNDFISSQGNELEIYLYEMDAHFIEAMFIRDYLPGEKYMLTDFEKLLLESLNRDNLRFFSMFLKGTDMDVVYNLYSITKKNIPKEEKIKTIEKMGDELLEGFRYPSGGSDLEKYGSVIPCKTYAAFMPDIIRRIEYLHGKPGNHPAAFYARMHPAIYGLCRRMLEMTGPYEDDAIKFHRMNLERFKKI
ncbi:MAG: hypothetical protein MUD12_03725 [Spirochaetes bacterium]|nr:hypothetical protein [Spirochaetota bacterium]